MAICPRSSSSVPSSHSVLGTRPIWTNTPSTGRVSEEPSLFWTTSPLTAVTPDEDKTYVLAVTGEGDNARVEKREVTIGAKNNLDALVKDGLKPGDRVITQVKDHQDLDGQTVDLGEA